MVYIDRSTKKSPHKFEADSAIGEIISFKAIKFWLKLAWKISTEKN